MHRVPESSGSDGEEAAPHDAVPYEIRSARRIAAAALVTSVVVCLVSASIVVRRATQAQASAAPLVAEKAVGLSEAQSASPAQRLQGLATGLGDFMEDARGVREIVLRPVPHHLSTQCDLHTEASATSASERRIPADVQVFPLSKRDGWTQVVVPETDVGGSHANATFGWLPEWSEGGKPLLVVDSELRGARPPKQPQPPPTKEKVAQAVSEARANNKKLQENIRAMQKKMMERSPQHWQALQDQREAGGQRVEAPAAQREARGQRARSEASKVVDLGELSSTLHELHKTLQQGMKSPEDLMGKIGKALE